MGAPIRRSVLPSFTYSFTFSPVLRPDSLAPLRPRERNWDVVAVRARRSLKGIRTEFHPPVRCSINLRLLESLGDGSRSMNLLVPYFPGVLPVSISRAFCKAATARGL